MAFDNRWETDVYKQSLQLNKYPFDQVVSAVMSSFGESSQRWKVRILEVGCGVGNNVMFLAQEGFTVTGIDGSKSAIQMARDQLAARDLSAELLCQDFTHLDNFDDCSFEMVIDRGSITHNRRADVIQAISEVCRVLKPGGLFVSFIFSTEHSGRQYGECLGDGSYRNFSGGNLSGHQLVFFFASPEDIHALYASRFELVSQVLELRKDALKKDNDQAMWLLKCRKS